MLSIRASELDRVLSCPGSLTLTPLVDPRQGDEGTEGTALHAASALRIVRDLGGTAPDGLPPPDPSWPSLKFSDWISQFYVRHIQENAPSDWSLEVECPLAYEFQLDAPVEMTVVEWVDGVPVITTQMERDFILSGHIDCVAISPDGTQAMGWDLKSGYDPVDSAEQSWQMLAYIILLLRAYPLLKVVTFFIVQPRNDEDEGHQRVSSVRLGEDVDLATVSRTFVRAVGTAMANSTELKAGRVQCKWCAAAMQCEELKTKRDSMKLTTEMIAAVRRQPDDATLADWVLASKTLARPMEDAEALAKERIAKEGSITARDGTQIGVKTTKGSIKILDPLGLWTALHGLLPGERLAACARWSFTALKDAVADHMSIHKGGKGATTGETVVATATGKFVQQGERKTLTFL